MLYGYDFDYSMLRIASMNMMTHGINNPNISYQDSLSQDAAELKEICTCVIANPPFKGSYGNRRGTIKWIFIIL